MTNMLWNIILMLLSARVVSATTGAFTEDEENQVAMVTVHGAVTDVHLEPPNKVQSETADQLAQEMMKADMDAIVQNPDVVELLRNRRSGDRAKRFLLKNSYWRWPKAIVPYNFNNNTIRPHDKVEIYAAFTRYHKYTCFRFVPWVSVETRTEYGLRGEGHIKFSKAGSCSATIGNAHSSSGQWCSCCNRVACTHELGHSLGLWHEHQSPMRHDFVRVNYESIPAYLFMSFNTLARSGILAWEFDRTSSMHYNYWFSNMYIDLRKLTLMKNQYYMYKEVSLSHDCQGLHCSNVTQECYNDGFMTLVDDKCSCLCPPGLDPATGCDSSIKQVTTSALWPAGAYAMFAPVDGCPGQDVFALGSWQHWGEGDNKMDSEVNLAGNFTKESFKYEFCVKSAEDDPAEAPKWETGRYCTLRAGGQCPSGFKSGYVQFDDSADVAGSGSGQLPDGNFSTDTRLEFCCRDDGFHSTPLSNVPNTEPFVLFPNAINRGKCQEVEGMHWTQEFIKFDSYTDLAGFGGQIPHGPSGSNLRITFCYYVPAIHDCGGDVLLNSSNPEAQIASPNFPSPYATNMECNWLIKTENEDDKILLNFDTFKITAEGDNCKDSLEVRYNLPGQPGIRYCGDGLSRTIRSLNDTIILTLRTDQHQSESDIGFNATVTLHSPTTDECYDPATKGTLYRGHVDYTRGMKRCLPWAEVTNCRSHAFKASDIGKGLEENYCRNPDNTAQPWCFILASNCMRDYCDVCNMERIYDWNPLCNNETVCSLSRDEILLAGCAATCDLEHPSAPIRDQNCGPPVALSDAEILEPTNESYSVGDTVAYKCLTGNETSVATCLSEGQWSPLGYVCGGCSPGWAFNRSGCYKGFEGSEVDAITANRVCNNNHAVLAPVKDQKEMEFVESLFMFRQNIMWIGLNDTAEEGSFVWSDGTPLGSANWRRGEPNNWRNQEDCVTMGAVHQGKKLNDIACGGRNMPFFACKYTLSERTACYDRLDCPRMLEEYPDLCTEQPAFVRHECPFSCAVCDRNSTTT